MYFKCFEWDISKKQTVIILSAILLLTIYLFLILFVNVLLHCKIMIIYMA